MDLQCRVIYKRPRIHIAFISFAHDLVWLSHMSTIFSQLTKNHVCAETPFILKTTGTRGRGPSRFHYSSWILFTSREVVELTVSYLSQQLQVADSTLDLWSVPVDDVEERIFEITKSKIPKKELREELELLEHKLDCINHWANLWISFFSSKGSCSRSPCPVKNKRKVKQIRKSIIQKLEQVRQCDEQNEARFVSGEPRMKVCVSRRKARPYEFRPLNTYSISIAGLGLSLFNGSMEEVLYLTLNQLDLIFEDSTIRQVCFFYGYLFSSRVYVPTLYLYVHQFYTDVGFQRW